ncbi:MAG: hypothetical protein WCI72_04200 [archaeon]
MAQFLIRTSSEEKKTHLVRVGNPAERRGIIYTDFKFALGIRDVSQEEVIDPVTNKAIGNVRLYKNDKILGVYSHNKEIATFTSQGEYTENGIVIPYKKMTQEVLLARPEYKFLEQMGITHAYFLGDGSSLSQVFCFQKGEDISAIVDSKDTEYDSALKGLLLAITKRIEDQDFIFEFMKK